MGWMDRTNLVFWFTVYFECLSAWAVSAGRQNDREWLFAMREAKEGVKVPIHDGFCLLPSLGHASVLYLSAGSLCPLAQSSAEPKLANVLYCSF